MLRIFRLIAIVGFGEIMNKDERKQLYKAVEKRVLDGERKSEIYAEYSDGQDAKLVARVLAQIL